jgi:spore germination protein GerM
LFKNYSLFFYDNQERYLIPETRWFATRVATSTKLVSALLAGPEFWLADAVQSSFPRDTKLALDSVLVQDGVAIVDLDASANSTTISQRQRMLVQLTATLTQLPNVFSVQIRIEGVPQNIANLPYQVSLANNPDPIVLSTEGFRQLSTDAMPMTRASEAALAWGA